jgi:hypothetical protein
VVFALVLDIIDMSKAGRGPDLDFSVQGVIVVICNTKGHGYRGKERKTPWIRVSARMKEEFGIYIDPRTYGKMCESAEMRAGFSS